MRRLELPMAFVCTPISCKIVSNDFCDPCILDSNSARVPQVRALDLGSLRKRAEGARFRPELYEQCARRFWTFSRPLLTKSLRERRFERCLSTSIRTVYLRSAVCRLTW